MQIGFDRISLNANNKKRQLTVVIYANYMYVQLNYR